MATDNAKTGGATATSSHAKDRLHTYCRDRDGVFDVFTICNPHGEQISHLYYWDEPDTNERHLAEMSAQLIVANLNRWYFDGWVDATDGPSGKKTSKIARQKKR